jgi:hypothetical protein
MYISSLWADEWVSYYDQRRHDTGHPTLDQIEAAIRQLDGRRRTAIGLDVDDVAYMGIAGGNDGKYIVFATYDNEQFFNLTLPGAPFPPEAMVRLVTGGQAGDFPANRCLDVEVALRAAKTFAVDGTLDPSLTWERQ